MFAALGRAAGIRWYANEFDDVGILPLNGGDKVCIFNGGKRPCAAGDMEVPPGQAVFVNICSPQQSSRDLASEFVGPDSAR